MFVLQSAQSYNYITDTVLLVFDVGIYIFFCVTEILKSRYNVIGMFQRVQCNCYITMGTLLFVCCREISSIGILRRI